MQSWRYTGVTRLLYWPGRNGTQFQADIFCLTRTLNSSPPPPPLMQPQLWNKASLPCRTVPLYCHCPLLHCWVMNEPRCLISWWAKILLWTREHNREWWAVIPFRKTPLLFIEHTRGRAHTHKNAAGQDNKAGGLKFPMYVLTAARFSAFPVSTAIGRWEKALVSTFWGVIICLTRLNKNGMLQTH